MVYIIGPVVLAAVIGYYGYRFIQLLYRMKHANERIILPLTDEDLASIRKQPDRALQSPTYSGQKTGIILYALVFIFMIGLVVAGVLSDNYFLSIYPLIFLPLLHTYNILNLFAITHDGIFCGIRFVAWNKIKTFEFIRIDVNHRYYGHSREVNDTYELKLRGRFLPISYIVTTTDMKQRLTDVLQEYVPENQQHASIHEG